MRTLARVPPFTDARVRREALRRKAQAGRARRLLFERVGSAKYSRPALFDMDQTLERHLPFDGGFFVEAGANDGFNQSNTYYFERFKGWTGILIEPIPELCKRCVLERSRSRVFNCALVDDAFAAPTVTVHYADLSSIVTGSRGSATADSAHVSAGSSFGWDETYDVDVPARTLTAVLDEVGAPEIDLLSLDVEGYEPQVLKGLDLDRYAPRYLLVEILDQQQTLRPLQDVLGARYEELERLSPHDVLYTRR